VSDAAEWLRNRLPGAPGPLLDCMIRALPADARDVPEALATAALSLYARVLDSSGGREDALPLLAADALLTHMFQAQAETDPDGVSDLATRWGAEGRLGDLVAKRES
jgi:hypothetical protein